MNRRPRRGALALLALLLPVGLLAAGCSSGSSGSTAGSTDPTAVATTKSGLRVVGGYGTKPKLTIPSATPATTLTVEVLRAGDGKTVESGQTLIANYLGQNWDQVQGKDAVFDNSFDRHHPSGFAIGKGQVIKGWDQGLVGQKLGSRVALTIPPALGYGEAKNSQNQLAGHTLVFVVDLIDAIAPDAAATGTTYPRSPGMPEVTSESGKKPVITSVAGVKPLTKAQSALLIKGTGAKIDPAKSLALQLVQTDTKTGKQTQETWNSEKGLQVYEAASVLDIAQVLKDQPVGSRAVVVTPDAKDNPSLTVVMDVVGQY